MAGRWLAGILAVTSHRSPQAGLCAREAGGWWSSLGVLGVLQLVAPATWVAEPPDAPGGPGPQPCSRGSRGRTSTNTRWGLLPRGMLGSGSPAWRGLRAGSLPFWDWRLLGQLRLLGQRQGVRLPVAALALGLASTCCNLTRPGRGRPCDAGHPCGIQAPLLQGRPAWLSLLPSVSLPSGWPLS